MEEFKRLSRDLVYQGAIIDYYKDTVQVPNGNVVKWDFIGHKGAAAVVAVRDDNICQQSLGHTALHFPETKRGLFCPYFSFLWAFACINSSSSGIK